MGTSSVLCRYPALKRVIAAKKKNIETVTAAELGVEVAAQLRQVAAAPPAPRPRGQLVSTVDELVERLRENRIV